MESWALALAVRSPVVVVCFLSFFVFFLLLFFWVFFCFFSEKLSKIALWDYYFLEKKGYGPVYGTPVFKILIRTLINYHYEVQVIFIEFPQHMILWRTIKL